jgi:hypothetical protein
MVAMASQGWPNRTKSTLSWHYLAAPTTDNGERWNVIWDTTRKPGADGRNTAVEKFESAALDRARHMLRMGFIVYEIRGPTGALFLEEAGIKLRLGLQPTAA